MISVLIPLYNKSQSIATTISSVLSQTYTEFEVIVVDDGSTDGSGDVVLTIDDDRIKYFKKENGGVSSARNYGIEKAQNELIALLDGDDLWEPTFLEEMLSLIELTPDAALWGAGYKIQEAETETVDLCIDIGYKGYVDNYFSVACHNTLFTSSSVIMRKSVVKNIGGYDESLTRGEDIDLWFRIALKYRVAFYNIPLAIYRWQTENRAMHKMIDKKKCLIWNLDRFEEEEKSNSHFKYMLDNWRLAHINNYLTGWSTEVYEITPLLKDMDLSKFGKRWRFIRYVPHSLQKVIFHLLFT